MRKKQLSHHSRMLSQAYSGFQIKAASDPPAVEMGRDFYWIIPSSPSQIKSPDLRQRDVNTAFQSWRTVGRLCRECNFQQPLRSRSRKKSSSGQEPACLEGAFLLVCVFLLWWWWLLHPPTPFQRHNGVIVFPTVDFPFEKQTSRSFPNLTHIQLWKEAASGSQGSESGKGSRASGTHGGWGRAGESAGL